MISVILKNRVIKFDRALVIDEPHIENILLKKKSWEMRSTRPPQKIIGNAFGLIKKGSGLIVGSAVLYAAGQPLHITEARITKAYHRVDDLDLLRKWKYPWVLTDVIRFKNPIHYDHPQGAVIWVKV